MSVTDIPDWCRWRTGSRPVLLIAPHGGRAEPDLDHAASRKVNDVHTADLTWTMAEALDASAIVNPELDRNRLDLNRISQVLRDAPWFPALIERLAAELLDSHPFVAVLFIHGWNVIQPKCDIGIGARFETEAAALQHTQLTVAPAYVAQRLHGFRALCTRLGVHASYGERYPASHANNMLQLFRQDGSRPCVNAPRLSGWARSGRIGAVQLELGVPLRWPGPLRDAFTQALTSAFGSDASSAPTLHTADTTHETSPQPAMLLTHDPRAQLGLLSGVSMQPNGRLGARLLLFSHGQTMALFTGEDLAIRGTVIGGPQLTTHDGLTQLSFAGPILQVDDAAAYVSLEHAFLQSRLIDVHIALSFRATHGDTYGTVRGTIRIDGTPHQIDTFGFRNLAIFLRRPRTHDTRLACAAAFGREIGLHATVGDASAPGLVLHRPDGPQDHGALTGIDVRAAPGSDAPQRLVLRHNAQLLIITPINRMHIRRSLAEGGAEMVYLGLGRFQLGERLDGYGFYEYVHRTAQ